MTVLVKDDVQIQKDVLDELRWDTRVSAPEVGIEVDKGIVTLTGTVTNYMKRIAAQEAAHRVAGVRDVANDIIVKVSGITMDTEIAQTVRNALKWDVAVPDERITSTVSEGWVTLEGGVDYYSQKQDAEHAVRSLTGVRGVANRINVQPSTASALEIRKMIESALERHAEREAQRIKVQISEGRVTLTGSVPSWSEKRAVLGAVGHAPGIRDVDDQLRVEASI